MFAIYTEKNAFENIVFLEDKKYPVWNKMFGKNVPILLNTSDADLDNELLDPDSPISLFLQSSAAARIPQALGHYFVELKETPEKVIDQPQSTFILDIQEDVAADIRKNTGVAIFSEKNIIDNFFVGGFWKEVDSGLKIPGGWKKLIEVDLPISNALVITDTFLFSNDEGGKNLGTENLVNLVDTFLPDDLKVEYHLAIVTGNSKKTTEFWTKLAGSLKARIVALRSYPINFELIITDTVHKRRLLSNYLNSWSDKGFDLFKNSDPETIRQNNDLHVYKIFHDINNTGTSHCESLVNGLKQLTKVCKDTVTYVQQNKQTEYRMILGDCNKDKTIKNRLLS